MYTYRKLNAPLFVASALNQPCFSHCSCDTLLFQNRSVTREATSPYVVCMISDTLAELAKIDMLGLTCFGIHVSASYLLPTVSCKPYPVHFLFYEAT